MTTKTPDALLKSALEKIVYFEARATQLQNDLDQRQSELHRQKGELGQAAQREIELRRVLAELEVRLQRAHSEREEIAKVAEAMRRERAELIGKILEASHIHDSTSIEGFDLGRFIAELRSEVLFNRGDAVRPVEPPAPARTELHQPSVPTASAPGDEGVARAAATLDSQGRLGVSADQLATLQFGRGFQGRTEETLFGFSVRELSAPDSSSRIRAAERLQALGHVAAAPPLATALHAESDPQVQIALLAAFSSFARAEGVAVVRPLLSSKHAEVRVAAVKALMTLDPPQARPHLEAAMKDPDKSVRRRAALLALSLTGAEAITLGEHAIGDDDPQVRELGALVLGAGSGSQSRGLILKAMRDSDAKVRQAAAQSLSKVLGADVTSVVSLDEAQRRREVRKLASRPTLPPRSPSAVLAATHKTMVAVVAPAAIQQLAAPAASAAAAPTPAAPAAAPSKELTQSLLFELRASIRGKPLHELASTTGAPAASVADALESLCTRGHVVKRGVKFFVA